MKRLVIAEIALIAASLLMPLPWACAAGDMRAGPSPNSPEKAVTTNGDVAERETLITAGKIIELRRSCNGSYGATLSYYAEQMTYYVALFQQSNIWRVFKTQNEARAEAVYSDFAKTSTTLADAEIKRIKLEAEKAYADRQISVQQERANRLQADLDIARAPQSQATACQPEQQNAIRELRTGRAAAQAQLQPRQTRVQELQTQSDGDLPAPVK